MKSKRLVINACLFAIVTLCSCGRSRTRGHPFDPETKQRTVPSPTKSVPQPTPPTQPQKPFLLVASKYAQLCVMDSRHQVFCQGALGGCFRINNLFYPPCEDATPPMEHLKFHLTSIQKLRVEMNRVCALSKQGELECLFRYPHGSESRIYPWRKIRDFSLSPNELCVLVDQQGIICRTTPTIQLEDLTSERWKVHPEDEGPDVVIKTSYAPIELSGSCAVLHQKTIECWEGPYESSFLHRKFPWRMFQLPSKVKFEHVFSNGNNTIFAQIKDGKIIEFRQTRKIGFISEWQNAKELIFGDHHICAWLKTGKMACRGDNQHGQVGRLRKDCRVTHSGKLDPRESIVCKHPKFMSDNSYLGISLGNQTTYAITSLGQLQCWGDCPHSMF
jgi:hypothetical protein